MRPTSASCRHAEKLAAAAPRPACVARRRGGSGGFTLLELLLVLTLVALLTGLVAPQLWRWVEGARLRADIDRVRTRLESLPRQAFADAQRIEIEADGPLVLPAGWRLDTTAPLVYEANGMTAGARLRLVADGAVIADWLVEAPAGTLRDAAPGDGPFRPGEPAP